MIDVALLGIIRRWHLRDQVPLREIAKRLAGRRRRLAAAVGTGAGPVALVPT